MDKAYSRALMIETRSLYARLLEAYATSGATLEQELNVFWAVENLASMRAILAEATDADEALERVQSTHLFQVNSADPAREYAVDWQIAALARAGYDLFALPPTLQESRYSPAAMRVSRGDRLLTPDFFRILNHALLVQRFCAPPEGALSFLELGAGCGHLARLLTMMYPASRYTIVDIPETLCFSYLFLRLNFPERHAHMITGRAESEHAAPVADFLLVPTLLADSIARSRVDVFLNTASMGEMKNDVIRYWMHFIQMRLQPTYLVTVNRYLNTIQPGPHDWRLNENECSVHYDDRWEILHWELEPAYFRCPYILPLAARHLEIVGRRLTRPSPDALARSRDAITQVEHQDWARFESAPAAMTLRDHALAPDLTIKGTLFALWNAIRLECTPRVVVLMLKYLATLLQRNNREFEEVFFYEELFEQMILRATAGTASDDTNEVLTWIAGRRYARGQGRSHVKLVKSVGQYNIIAAGDEILALAQALGPLDLFSERLGTRELAPHILIGSDVASLEQRIVREFGNPSERLTAPQQRRDT